MTKLGVQPGVHGGEDLEKEAIKIDPKVFTVLQPTIIPMPAAPIRQAPAAHWNAMRACLHCLFFVTCLFLVALLGLYFLAATPDIFKKIETSDKPQMEALISAKPVEGSSSDKSSDSNIVAIPLARVVVVEDISNNSNEGQKKTLVDGSVESIEKSSTNLDNFNNFNTNNRPLHPDEMEQYRIMEARQYFQRMMAEQEQQYMMQQMLAMRMMRMRRLQAAYQQQQQMKMAYFQQQQHQLQEEAARQQWAERARYEEDQQQRRQWEAQQAYAQQQRQAQSYWQQHQMEMQAQAQAQQIQQAQMMQQRHFQRPSVWQQPPQQFFFPQQQQQQQQSSSQEQQQQPQFPEVSAPFFQQPAPQPSVHDKIYEELQKKSQNIPVNAPTRQIWTAITPSPASEESPVNTAAAPVTTTQMPDAAEVSDTILRDIFSAFDEQKNSEAAKELQGGSSTTEEPELEGKDAIVIEDSFPRIEERTTTPEPTIQEDSDEEIETSSVAGDHEKELDPFAAVLKFFENNPPHGAVENVPASTEKPIIV